MMDHLHGSTAICGLVYYQADHFQPAFAIDSTVGNVIQSHQLQRDRT